MDLHNQSNCCDDFYENLIKNDPNLTSTDKMHPEYHLSLWSRKYIKELKEIAFFDNCVICLKNKSKLKIGSKLALLVLYFSLNFSFKTCIKTLSKLFLDNLE